MHRLGHYGVALGVYAPLMTILLLLGAPLLAGLGLMGILLATRWPDIDLKLPFITHRGPTHTVWFAGLVGFLYAGLFSPLSPLHAGHPYVVPAFGFLIGFLSIGSHLLADAITPSGVTPFYPLKRNHYTADLTTADSRVANILLLLIGMTALSLASLVPMSVIGAESLLV